MAKTRAIPPAAWTEGRFKAWADAQDRVAHAVTLYHPRPGCQVLMFPDTSERHWGRFVTQAADAEMDQNLPVEDEPLAFLSGTFKGSQMRWATIDKEGFAIVSTFRRLEQFLWNGVHIFTDHRNLDYIFDPEACVTSVSKALAQRLERLCLCVLWLFLVHVIRMIPCLPKLSFGKRNRKHLRRMARK